MQKIPLTQNKYALVDDVDFEWLNMFKWYYNKGTATRNTIVGDKKTIVSMHRLIMAATDDKEIDHINHNQLDNRRENLRLASRHQNACNRPRQKNNTSGFKGVYWCRNVRKWRTKIKVNNKCIHVGLFTDRREAAEAYDRAAHLYHGKFASFNFPTL